MNRMKEEQKESLKKVQDELLESKRREQELNEKLDNTNKSNSEMKKTTSMPKIKKLDKNLEKSNENSDLGNDFLKSFSMLS